MDKRNLILQSAIALALATGAASAQAGTIATTFKTYASELFGTGSDAVAITPTAVSYQFGVPVASAQTIQIYVALSGGAKFVAGKVTGAGTDMKCVDAASVVVTGSAGAISTDSTYAVFTIATGGNGFSTNSVCTYTPLAASVNTLKTALSASGGAVTATWTNDTGAAALGGVPTGGTNIDTAGTHTGNIAQSANALNGAITASSAFAAVGEVVESKRINVAATPTSTTFDAPVAPLVTNTAVGVVNLGKVVYTNAGGIQDDGTGADYTIAKAVATGVGIVATGNFAGVGTGGTVTATTDPACTVTTGAGSLATLDAGKTTATFTGVTTQASAAPIYICYTDGVGATTAANPVIPTSAFNATSTLDLTAATDLDKTVAASPLYTLQLNGSTVDVRSYVPVGNIGYTSWVRVINTGSVAAPISGMFVNADGTAGASGTLVSSLPAGGSVSLNANQVEAQIGAPSGGAVSRPRLRVSAPTNGMQVQSFISNPDNSITDMTGAQ